MTPLGIEPVTFQFVAQLCVNVADLCLKDQFCKTLLYILLVVQKLLLWVQLHAVFHFCKLDMYLYDFRVRNGRNSVFEGMEAACRGRLPIHLFRSLSYDRSVATSKASSP